MLSQSQHLHFLHPFSPPPASLHLLPVYTQGGDAERQGEGKMDGESGDAETGKAQRERQEADCPIGDAEDSVLGA